MTLPVPFELSLPEFLDRMDLLILQSVLQNS